MTTSTIRVLFQPTNPGQFFACCGLLEMADRLWGGVEGWFNSDAFCLRSTTRLTIESPLSELLSAIACADLRKLDLGDDFSSPIEIPPPFDLRLDWWKDSRAGGDRLK